MPVFALRLRDYRAATGGGGGDVHPCAMGEGHFCCSPGRGWEWPPVRLRRHLLPPVHARTLYACSCPHGTPRARSTRHCSAPPVMLDPPPAESWRCRFVGVRRRVAL
eukprot:1708062-Prymnesium_polylepis.1